MMRGLFATLLLAAALIVPSQAMAAAGSCSGAGSDPTEAQYCSPGAITGHGNSPDNSSGPNNSNHGVKGEQESGSTPTDTPSTGSTPTVSTEPAPTAVEASQVEESSSGSLPFTGLDVGILVLVAAGLTGTGLVLRRLTSSSGASHS